ncbi:MAG: VWA domain-containing protein [Candidatus Omnitrophica bacterium]|nr:VWA domain-containing protein [Candidatus Omnitrophota bacterium]
MMHIAYPLVLVLLLFIPPAVFILKKMETRLQSSLRFSDTELVKKLRPSFKIWLSRNLIYLRAFSLVLLIFALARPQSVTEETKINIEGIDIVLVLDTSTSMRALDFTIRGRMVDRLEAVRGVVFDFIKKRPNDRIGMVAFSAFAYTICPLTLDHAWLEKNMDRVKTGMIQDGTAIGSAITAALNRLKDKPSKGKIIILLTDGCNNAGSIAPLSAAEAAKALGVKIYTVGAGTKGEAPYPVPDMFGNIVIQKVKVEIDEDLLKKIADTTGGIYYRATDTESLQEIYDEIDRIEKTPIEETGYNIYDELFWYFLMPGLILLILEVVIANTYLKRIP